MKQLRIILLLIVMIVIVIFSVQNAELVSIQFMGFTGELSKTLLMVICFTTGSIVTLIAFLPRGFKKKNKAKEQVESARVDPTISTEQEENA